MKSVFFHTSLHIYIMRWPKQNSQIVPRYHRSPVAKFLTLIFGWACINYFFLLRRGFLGRKARQWQLRNPMNDLRRRHYLVANINLIEELPQKQEKSWFSPVKFNCFSDVKNGNNLSFFSAPRTVIKKNTSVLIRMIYTLSNIYVFHHTKEENSKIKCCPMIQKIIFLWW